MPKYGCTKPKTKPIVSVSVHPYIEEWKLPSPYRLSAVDFPANDFPKTIIFNPNAGNNGGGILSLKTNLNNYLFKKTKHTVGGCTRLCKRLTIEPKIGLSKGGTCVIAVAL